MLDRKSNWLLLCLALLAPAVSAISLHACSVPVFRYALEHWPADPYQAIVFHRGPLSETEQALVRDLSADGLAGRLYANVSLHTIDLDQNPTPEEAEFWRQLGAETLPWVVVRYPLAVRLPHNVWSGPLSQPALEPILDSPARQEIARRIIDGQSGVWVLLEIGDADFDSAAAKFIETRLAYLMTVLQLPTLEAQDIASGLVSVGNEDLKLEFSVLRLSRNDPAEEAFVKMLLGTEADLGEIDAPMVFPIFGRGRALYALIGGGINRETIDEAAAFLIGKCSCQVKELNPGTDLLLAADWDGALKKQARPPSELPTLAELAESAPVTVTISGGEEEPDSSTSAARLIPFGMVMAGGFAFVGLIAGFLFFGRKR
jgi:hypothetical protein